VSAVFSDPVAAVLFWATYLAFVLLDARLVTRAMTGRAVAGGGHVTRGPVHRPCGLLWLMAGEGIAVALATVAAFQLPWTIPLLVIGLVAAWAGIALRWWAKRTLGRFFVGAVVIQEGHHVVSGGPYAILRHPGYAGSMLALIGFGVATANVASIAAFTLTAFGVFVRTISIEERVLRAELGDPYLEYSRRTARLVPGLW
jgi:protein-S-isoprenylcysteine O-methyltransferase Ste14